MAAQGIMGRAIADFHPELPDELGLTVGALVRNVTACEEPDANWCYGECSDRKGYFPASFIEPFDPEVMTVKRASRRLSPITARAGELTAKALFSNEALNDDELSFPEHVTIRNVMRDDDNPGWYFGTYGARNGIFPANFVQLNGVDSRALTQALSRSAATDLASVEILEGLVKQFMRDIKVKVGLEQVCMMYKVGSKERGATQQQLDENNAEITEITKNIALIKEMLANPTPTTTATAAAKPAAKSSPGGSPAAAAPIAEAAAAAAAPAPVETTPAGSPAAAAPIADVSPKTERTPANKEPPSAVPVSLSGRKPPPRTSSTIIAPPPPLPDDLGTEEKPAPAAAAPAAAPAAVAPAPPPDEPVAPSPPADEPTAPTPPPDEDAPVGEPTVSFVTASGAPPPRPPRAVPAAENSPALPERPAARRPVGKKGPDTP